MILLFFPSAPPAAAGFINTATLVGDLWPPLNATGPTDAVFWAEDELYQWIDEGAKKLARNLGVFVDYDDSTIQTVANVKDYALPTNHVATIQADLNKTTLRARNVQDLEALDAGWPSTPGSKPKAFLEDTLGLARLTLYPPPDVANESLFVGLTLQKIPPEITAATAILVAPPAIQDYFAFYALAEARSKETNASMEEISQWLLSICSQYEDVMRGLWG